VPTLDVVWSKVMLLQEENASLRDCLSRSGCLNLEALLAEMHRRRFVAVLRSRPLGCSLTLSHAFAADGPILNVAQYVGLRTIQNFCSASRGLNERMLNVRGILRDSCAASFYVCGGEDGQDFLDSVERFDALRREWEILPPMLSRRFAAAAVVLSGRLHICGGMRGPRDSLQTVECFDPAINVWENSAPMSQRRYGLAVAAIGGHIYACDGKESPDDTEPFSSTERFDPEGPVGVWQVTPMQTNRSRFAAASATVQGQLHVCGGMLRGQCLRSVERLDLEARAWRLLPPMTTGRASAAAAAVAGRLCVYGGTNGQQDLDSVECFDPDSSQWEVLRPMPQRRSGLSVVVHAGFVYVFGGTKGQDGQRLREISRLDPVIWNWDSSPPMLQPRAHAAAALVVH